MAGQDHEQGQGDAYMEWQRNLITNYLKTHPEYVCVACLAQFIDVPASQISMLRHQLMSLTVEIGLCSRCRRTQIVMKSA